MTVADFAPMLGMLIGLGVGIDYALFIVTRHRRGLKRGLPVAEAAANAVATTGRAVVFAGATVCIALLGMLILRLGFLNGVAIAASLTVVLTVAASVTLLPALLSFIGLRALEPPRAAQAGRARARAGAAHRVRRPLVRVRGAPPQAARRRRRWSSSRCSPCPRSRSTSAPPTRATTRRRRPHGRPTTSSPTVSAPASTARSPSSTQVGDAEDRLALDNLAATLRTTEGVASAAPVTYSPSGDTAYLTVVPTSSPQSAADQRPGRPAARRRAARAPRRAPRSTCTSAGSRRATTTSRTSSSASCRSSSAS